MKNYLNTFTKTTGTLFIVGAAALAGCATAPPPKELLDARAAYTRAENSEARTLNPAGLHDAKVALNQAEDAYMDDAESVKTKDTAYLAERRAELAEVQASTRSWQMKAQQAQAKSVEKTQSDLQAARGDLAKTREQLDSEKSAREAADAKAKDALTRLAMANAAAVKEEPRGTVITLQGNVLFASNKSALLPGAQQSLDQVADALKDQDDKRILVEGHTDSRGSDATNQALSKARADAVGSYLITKGVPQERVTTAGIGSSRPVADNNSAEGRANNRRVEIVVQPQEPK